MAPDNPTPPSNGAIPTDEAPKSLREIAESAWDEVVEGYDEDLPADEPAGQSERPRDNLGRFVKPGEAEPPAPSPDDDPDRQAPSAQPPDPARPPESNQAPQHWPAEHREMFAKQSPEAQRFLLDRHSEMERDYTQKAQASASAVSFTTALAPYFQDPLIAGSLQQNGASPFDAIVQLLGFHRRAVDPNPQVRFDLLQELTQRLGLDPAAIGQVSQPGNGMLPDEALKDPAIKYFADHIGRTTNEVQQLKNTLSQMQQADTARQNAEAIRTARWGIDQFADEKDAQGKPLHPEFDEALPALIEIFRANPSQDIRAVYEDACWRTKSIRDRWIAARQEQTRQAASTARARQAVRSNVRGVTSPVSKPAAEPGGAKSLRDVLEESADEVGFN